MTHIHDAFTRAVATELTSLRAERDSRILRDVPVHQWLHDAISDREVRLEAQRDTMRAALTAEEHDTPSNHLPGIIHLGAAVALAVALILYFF